MNAAERAQRRILISQMISGAAVAVLVGMGTVIVVPLQDRDPSVLFWALMILSAGLMTWSLIVCGRAIASAERPEGLFNLQAWLTTGGLVLFVAGLFLMGPRIATDDGTVHSLRKEIDSLRIELQQVRSDATGLRQDVGAIRTTLDELLLQQAARGGPQRRSGK